jgi:hypothetical protein
MLRTITATGYVMPLREGGSLPAIVEGDDDGTYVLKFRGAGQGPRALIAELVSGEIARLLGLPVPEIVFALLDPRMAKTEPDPEIQDLLRKSEGLNLALDYLPGSVTFDPLVHAPVTNLAALASSIVWFDAFVSNVDRTPKNTNLLVWHRNLWLIDHNASLIFHHSWLNPDESARRSFPQLRDHVLLPWATEIERVDDDLAQRITPHQLEEILALIPESWLGDEPQFASVDAHRDAYLQYFLRRLEPPRPWMEDALRARTIRV